VNTGIAIISCPNGFSTHHDAGAGAVLPSHQSDPYSSPTNNGLRLIHQCFQIVLSIPSLWTLSSEHRKRFPQTLHSTNADSERATIPRVQTLDSRPTKSRLPVCLKVREPPPPTLSTIYVSTIYDLEQQISPVEVEVGSCNVTSADEQPIPERYDPPPPNCERLLQCKTTRCVEQRRVVAASAAFPHF
jgi:hypothetical protein